MNVIPLSIQLVNWDEYIKVYKALCGVSPTSSLDDRGIALTDPRALVEVTGDPRISYYSFVCTVPSDIALEIAISEITMVRKEHKNDCLIILSTNLLVWEQEMLRYCTDNHTYDTRKLFNAIYKIFYKNQLMNYKKKVLQDGTFTLTRGNYTQSWQV